MNPKSYCIETNMRSADFIARAQEVAPKYNKITHCMASNPEYGVMLMPAVAQHVLASDGAQAPRKPNRTRPCKFTFRLLESDCAAFNAARKVFGHSKQEAAEYAARLYIDEALKRSGEKWN